MPFDILTVGEALVELNRTGLDQPLHQPGPFMGPFPSGAPFIFAVQAARLGASVAAIGTVGDDPFGRCLRDQLAADGVDTHGLRVSPDNTTGVAFVAYAGDGSRDFVFHLRHAAAGELSPDHLDESLFRGLKVLHMMGSTLSIHEQARQTSLRALELAQAAGSRISFDPNVRPQLLPADQARETFRPFLEAADVIMPTAEEAQLLTGTDSLPAAVDALLGDKDGRIVIVTAGEAGCTVYTHEHAIQVPGFSVQEVDPTGAGDCFDAGFLVRWLAGDSPALAVLFANACGALAVTAQGAMSGAQPLAVVRAFIREQEAAQ